MQLTPSEVRVSVVNGALHHFCRLAIPLRRERQKCGGGGDDGRGIGAEVDAHSRLPLDNVSMADDAKEWEMATGNNV